MVPERLAAASATGPHPARGSLGRLMRALIVTNMYPSPEAPARGSFVRDQVRALERIEEVALELFTFEPGGLRQYAEAIAAVGRRYRGRRFDVVHSHFGLTAWPAFTVRADVHALTMHGNDLVHPRSRAITLAALPFLDIPAVVSSQFSDRVPRWALRKPLQVLPCGVATDRFRPIARREARERLGLDPDGPYLLFPHDPARPVKRFADAQAVAGDVPLLTMGRVDPDEVPYYVNAANAVLVPSEWESLGLAVLEALACDVPVLATPTGVHEEVLAGVAGTHCGPFDAARWRAELEPALAAADPRVDGRSRVERFSSDRTAARVVEAWRAALGAGGGGVR